MFVSISALALAENHQSLEGSNFLFMHFWVCDIYKVTP